VTNARRLICFAQNALTVVIKADNVKCVFTNIDTNRHQIIKLNLRRATSPICK